MAEDLPIDELLIKYLDDELNPEDRSALQAQLNSNPLLQKRLDGLRLAKDSVKYYGIHQEVAEVRRIWERETQSIQQKQAKVISLKKPLRYSLMIAASTILIIIGIRVFFAGNSSPDKIYNEAYVSYSLDNMRSGNIRETEIERAWKEKNYPGVINLAKKNNLSTKEQFLTGLSYLELNQAAPAISELETVRKSSDTSYHYDVDFYLALAYLKNKDFNNALVLLEKIQKDPNHLYHNQVSNKMIKEVKSLK